jgi:hypothetical protein
MSWRPRIRPKPAVALAVLAIGGLSSCGLEIDSPDPHDDASCEAAFNDPDSADAFEWLKKPFTGPKRVVGKTTDDGLAYAHELESRGAKRITAVRVRTVAGPEPVQTAEGLVVEMPVDPVRRLALFKMYGRLARDAGLAPRADTGQKYLFFPSKS